MKVLMFYQITLFTNRLMTLISICTHHYASVHALPEDTLACPITHITSKWALTTKNLLMFYQTALMTECLITHSPGIRALTNIFGLMNFKNALFTG